MTEKNDKTKILMVVCQTFLSINPHPLSPIHTCPANLHIDCSIRWYTNEKQSQIARTMSAILSHLKEFVSYYNIQYICPNCTVIQEHGIIWHEKVDIWYYLTQR